MTSYRRPLLTATLLSSLSLPALAGGNPYHPDPPPPVHPANNSVAVQTNPRAHAAASADATARAASRSAAIARGGNASSVAAGGAGGRGGFAQGGNASNGGVSVTTAYDRLPVASAYAPTIVNPTCSRSVAGGLQTNVLGLSFGANDFDPSCQLVVMGRPDIAFEMLCERSDVRRAAARAGTPCAADRPQVPQPAAQPVAAAPVPAQPSYCRPLPRNASAADRLMQQRNCG